jgi:NTP pyrophosphatase (non-canonical NTP hydrolase)
MTPTEYIQRATALEANDYCTIETRLFTKMRLMHALIGINTENGELQDQFKKHIFYGKPLDQINLKEELGDLMWYVALACDELNFTLEDVMETNIRKLELRYAGKKFTETQALGRDLDKERKILEGEK